VVSTPLATAAAETTNETADQIVPCQLAVKSHMIRGEFSPSEKISIVKRAGFDGVELSMRDSDDIDEWMRAAEKTGIVLHGLTHGTSDDYEAPLRMCKAIGGDAVLVIAREDPEKSYDENFAAAQEIVRVHLPLADKLQVRLLIENVRASFLKTAEEMARFIDSLDSGLVGAYYDTGNTITWTEQSAEHWARVLGKRIAKMDIKDRGHATFGDPPRKRPGVTGTDGGEVHWRNVRNELSKIGFHGWATAEVTGGDEEHLTQMCQWMRNVLAMS
tara:strand:- start:9129 stop:9947 length:819 start_codon:yes stop_codon:yes gene_type:complete